MSTITCLSEAGGRPVIGGGLKVAVCAALSLAITLLSASLIGRATGAAPGAVASSIAMASSTVVASSAALSPAAAAQGTELPPITVRAAR